MKLKIKLASIWSTIAPIVLPIVVSAATGVILKQGEKIITGAKR